MLAIYKDVHSHPELSTQEKRTSALVAKELKAAGYEVTDHIGKYDQPGLTGYGVVGVMKNGDGPVVLVRTDMDALPVEEETGLPYASKVTAKNNAGEEVHVMHACGHDVHIATFIGVARALAKLKTNGMARSSSSDNRPRKRSAERGNVEGRPLHALPET